MYNDKELTQKILDVVKELDVSVHIRAIEQLQYTDTDDLWELGYNEGVRDALAALKGEL